MVCGVQAVSKNLAGLVVGSNLQVISLAWGHGSSRVLAVSPGTNRLTRFRCLRQSLGGINDANEMDMLPVAILGTLPCISVSDCTEWMADPVEATFGQE